MSATPATTPRLAASAAVGYLLGTFPSADVVMRLAGSQGVDLRRHGTSNPGAANAIALVGKAWGGTILGADMAKGVAACVIGRRLAGDGGTHLAGTAAVVGHCFPAWNGFRGGKGVATSCGQCLATFPVYFPVDLGVAWAVARWRRRALTATVVASAAWVAAASLWSWRRWPNAWGPRPTVALPAAAAATSAVVLSRFLASERSR